MLTFSGRRNLFGDLSGNSASATLTLADTLMNQSERKIISFRNWSFLERQYTLSSISDTVTVTIASPGVFTLTAHGFVPGQVVYFSTTGALPTGLTAGTAYYIITAGLTADAFEVSTTIGGTAVNTSGSQSGTHTVKTQQYVLPAYTRKPESVFITVSNQRYVPREVSTRREWDLLNQTVVYSDTVTHYFVYDGVLMFYPIITTADVIVTINARRIFKDLNVADYTTSSVDAVTNGSTAVTGTGGGTPTVWTAPMVGRWLRITHSDTAASSGDGVWYEIAARTSNTAIVLRKAYQGTTLASAAAAAYIIGEVGLLPEDHQFLPLWRALWIYFTSVNPNRAKATDYKEMYREGYAEMVKDFGAQADVVLDSGEEFDRVNPNLTIELT